jgi:hypothetical protein
VREQSNGFASPSDIPFHNQPDNKVYPRVLLRQWNIVA